MKKVILLLSAMLCLVLSVSAEKQKEEKQPVSLEYHKTGHGGFNTGVNRTLIEFPSIEVVYSYALNAIQITSDAVDDGEVYVYDNSGAMVGYANTLNANIQLPSASGTYTIYIIGTDWYALGYLNK